LVLLFCSSIEKLFSLLARLASGILCGIVPCVHACERIYLFLLLWMLVLPDVLLFLWMFFRRSLSEFFSVLYCAMAGVGRYG